MRTIALFPLLLLVMALQAVIDSRFVRGLRRASPSVTLKNLHVAIANTPTNVYQVNAWDVGTLEIEPWRQKLTAVPVLRRLVALSNRLREWLQLAGGIPSLVTAACLLAMLCTGTAHAAPIALMGTVAAVADQQSLKALRQKAGEIHTQLKTLNAKATAHALDATAPALTDEERASVTTLKAQAESVKDLLGEAERLNEEERNFKIVRPDPDAVAQAAARRIETGEDLTAVGEAKKPGFWGRQLQAVRKIAVRDASDEDIKLAKMMGGPTGLNTDVPSDGGFLVGQERSTTIIQRSYETGVILSRVRRMPIGPNSNGMKLPAIDETSRANGSRYGGIASGWLGQGNTLTAGRPKFREMDMKLRKVGAFVYATDEQIADSIALEGWINTYLPLELQFRVEDAFVNGLGGNQPLGAALGDHVISVTRATTGHITSDDFRAMYSKMWAPLRSNAVFLIDQSSEPDLDLLTIAVGTGGVLDPSFKAAGTTPGQKYPTYKGVPIITVEYCAQLGTAGDLVMVAFDEYLSIDKGGVEQAVSLHVAFLTDEAVYRFMYRVDGQMSWNNTLTLKSGAVVSSVISLT